MIRPNGVLDMSFTIEDASSESPMMLHAPHGGDHVPAWHRRSFGVVGLFERASVEVGSRAASRVSSGLDKLKEPRWH
jgi:hypothetical protein